MAIPVSMAIDRFMDDIWIDFVEYIERFHTPNGR
jgi:hypothetical protein